MANIFHVPNLTNKPSKNGFDLSFKNSFSAKIGELLPIMHRTLMPGDKVKLKIQHRTVTTPLESSAFTNFTEYFDFFFVPYRLLHRDAPQILTQTVNNPQYATAINKATVVGTQLPWFNSADVIGDFTFNSSNTSNYPWIARLWQNNNGQSVNYQGFNLGYEALKLWNYLGGSYVSESYLSKSSSDSVVHSPINSHPYSALPFAAYQKIYFDYYRFDQWENNRPECYNFDYLTGTMQLTKSVIGLSDKQSNLFTLRHCNYPKDLFFGILPSPQYDTTAVAEVSSYGLGEDPWSGQIPRPQLSKSEVVVSGQSDTANVFSLGVTDSPDVESDSFTYANLGIDIFELRRAKALQRYREVVGTGNQDYRSMVKKIYGEDIPKHYNQQCQYLGGFSNVIDVNSIINSNLTDGAQPQMMGVAQGTDEQSKPISFEADEHGCIMCIYRVLPLLDYALTAPHFDMLKTEVDDFANPFFDRLGMQELPWFYLSDKTNLSSSSCLGYVPRYFDYKTSVDVVNGCFRSTMKHWVAVLDDSYVSSYLGNTGVLPELGFFNYDFFKVNSHLVDDVFFLKATQSVDTDQFLVNSNIQFNAVRNLDYDGLPKGN